MLDLTESANALTTHEEVATCVCVDDRSDDMYFVRRLEEEEEEPDEAEEDEGE